LIDPPPIELVTERVVMRVAHSDEAQAVVDFQTKNRAHFARWDPRRGPEFFSTVFWRERLHADARAALEDRAYRFFLFSREAPDRVIGHVHFANVVRGAFHSCHLGFGLDRDLEGKGVMREALERAIDWAFEEALLHRIEANHRPDNVRSAGLLRRLGFVPQGYARDYLRIDGAWHDHVLTALLNSDWTPPPSEF
jgi:ribosomal-protein-alanine N-acetyltransferase